MFRSLGLLWVLLAGAAAAADAPPPAADGVHYVYLVRHGIYDRLKDVDDRVGNGLNALGHEQARLVGAKLAALPVRVASLVSSDLTRARETADDMGAVMKLTAVRDSLIRECTPGSERNDPRDSPEEIAQCESSLAAAWAKYARPTPEADRHDVLVCHGNVIRWFVCKALVADTRHWTHMDIGNGSLTVIAIRPDSTSRLVMFSDVGHLPLEKQTWSGRGAGWAVQRPVRK